MENKALAEYTGDDLLNILSENVDAIVMVDTENNKYRAMTRKGIFMDLLDETGDYKDLIEKIWIHMKNKNEEMIEDYRAFTSYYGEFKGKYSRRVKVFPECSDTPIEVQMNVYPVKDLGIYVFVMDALDDEAFGFAERLRKTIAETDFGEVGHITSSIGISRLKNTDAFQDFFERVDKAMYYSKEAGRNKVTIL